MLIKELIKQSIDWISPQSTYKNYFIKRILQFRGFVRAYHLATPGLSSKLNIYALFNLYFGNRNCYCYWNEKRRKINEKEAGVAPYL